LNLAQRQHEAGNINDPALAQRQTSYSRSRLDVATTEAEIRRNREQLNLLLGLWGTDTDWQIAGELPEVPSSDFPIEGLERLAISQPVQLPRRFPSALRQPAPLSSPIRVDPA
jgi:outer membrane protein, heavy metal efflux system